MTLHGFLEPDAGKLARPVLRGERTRKGSALPDWALIGARKWTNPEGEELVLHRGHAYRRRELEAVDSRKMKLPAAIKYSRGAKNTDPDHVREKADGEFEYVTLAMFRGGKRQERFATQGGQQRSAQAASAPAPTRPAPAQSQARPQAQPAPTKTSRAPETASEEEIPF